MGWEHVIGAGQLGVLLAIYYRLGGLDRAIAELRRRVTVLEQRKEKAA